MDRRRWMGWALCAALAAPAMLLTQAGARAQESAGQKMTPAESLNALLTREEHEVVGIAEAMPADKYDFAPSTSIGLYAGVRTFGEQVKHLTEANYAMFRGWGVPGAVDRNTIEGLKSKDQLVDALKKSYAYVHAAVNTITPQNAFISMPSPEGGTMTRVTIAAFCMAHAMDHYGQMVEYLRMNGIVPPASRRH